MTNANETELAKDSAATTENINHREEENAVIINVSVIYLMLDRDQPAKPPRGERRGERRTQSNEIGQPMTGIVRLLNSVRIIS